MLAVRPLSILVIHCRDLDHLAVITLAAQPAEKRAFEQLGVESVCFWRADACEIPLHSMRVWRKPRCRAP
jgi:hypothetical protein